MGHDVVLILPGGPGEVRHETPYGVVTGRPGVLFRDLKTDARALIYAAKASGARRVLASDVVQAISPLLEPGDLLVPADAVDQTRLRPATFFVGKGYGFIRLDPPFCPVLGQALYEAGRSVSARLFQRATYVCAEGPREATPAELRMYRQWGADVVGTALLPEAYLAREFELCYAALVSVGEADLRGVLEGAARAIPALTCTCGQAMAGPRAAGLIGEDWHTW